MISLMEQIGIVKYTNSGYHFTKSGNKDYHRARLYFYFPENEKRFLDYCNENGIFCEEEKLMSHSVYTNTPLPTFTSF